MFKKGLPEVPEYAAQDDIMTSLLHNNITMTSLDDYVAFYGLILVDSKSGDILMPNDLIALGFSSYQSTFVSRI